MTSRMRKVGKSAAVLRPTRIVFVLIGLLVVVEAVEDPDLKNKDTMLGHVAITTAGRSGLLSCRREVSTLILLRHGQSQWNKPNPRFSGWVDVPLTVRSTCSMLVLDPFSEGGCVQCDPPIIELPAQLLSVYFPLFKGPGPS